MDLIEKQQNLKFLKKLTHYEISVRSNFYLMKHIINEVDAYIYSTVIDAVNPSPNDVHKNILESGNKFKQFKLIDFIIKNEQKILQEDHFKNLTLKGLEYFLTKLSFKNLHSFKEQIAGLITEYLNISYLTLNEEIENGVSRITIDESTKKNADFALLFLQQLDTYLKSPSFDELSRDSNIENFYRLKNGTEIIFREYLVFLKSLNLHYQYAFQNLSTNDNSIYFHTTVFPSPENIKNLLNYLEYEFTILAISMYEEYPKILSEIELVVYEINKTNSIDGKFGVNLSHSTRAC